MFSSNEALVATHHQKIDPISPQNDKIVQQIKKMKCPAWLLNNVSELLILLGLVFAAINGYYFLTHGLKFHL